MKKNVFILFFLLSLLFIACDKSQTIDDTSNANSGFAKMVGAVSPESGDDGIYFFPTDNFNNGILNYWNLTEDICVPLCGKANCTHTDQTCDAWFNSPSPGTLQRYGDKIYLWCGYQSSLALYSINLDGTQRTKICNFSNEDKTGGWIESSVVSGNTCYINMSFGQDRKGSDINGVYSVSLTDGTAKLIRMNNEDSEWLEHRLYDVIYDNGMVYYKITEYRTGEARSRIFKYNPDSYEDTLIFETDAKISEIIAGGKLYYMRLSDDTIQNKMFVFDLNSNKTDVFPVPYVGYLTYDGTHLYIMNQDENHGICTVFDLNGNLIDQIEDGFQKPIDTIDRLTSKDQIIFRGQNISENGVSFIYHVFNKSDIGKEQVPCHEAVFTN